jgi:hypothetical protein
MEPPSFAIDATERLAIALNALAYRAIDVDFAVKRKGTIAPAKVQRFERELARKRALVGRAFGHLNQVLRTH